MTKSIYGCHGSAPRDPDATIPVQDGWYYRPEDHTREPIIIHIKSPMTSGCQYTIRTPDPHCDGCPQAAR